ncbi:SgcJ/EcaC family oxidoreductase [Micromonospora sp. KC723]|uniref:SgcJ/EcaC family oxidoreductase n=1 Tax=Micromonospora sp. KC723 TaxID=2530381 RepID=UPI0010472647|nr:SgcJ/EcaC family oxidoreductase [Micromonospora sp. KC723]TDB69751.1 SgcJ/EcaC family oxidoreductase [Micromonospora sp. KC723]
MRRTARIVVTGAVGAALVGGTGAYAWADAGEAKRSKAAASNERKPTKETIANLFTEWNAALATGDPEVVADRYANDAVLLPTVSNQVRTNRAQFVDYFGHFLEKKPQGEIKQSYISILDRNTAVDTGVYVFTLAATGQQVEARYTYVYELRDGKWMIVNHHSSAMPESS